MLIPSENQADVGEMDKEITQGLEIIPVNTMEDVLKYALVVKQNS